MTGRDTEGGQATRWVMTAELARDPVTGGVVWRTHAQWFDPAGRMIGEEWRRFHGADDAASRGPGRMASASAAPPDQDRNAVKPAWNRWADRLILICLAAAVATGLAVWGHFW